MAKNRTIWKMIINFRLALAAGFAYTVLYAMHQFPAGRDVRTYLLIAGVATAIFTVKCIYHTARFVRMELQTNRQPAG